MHLSCPAASLWTSIFNAALDLGLNHDAYTAAISNPQPDLLVDSIRRLLYALVDRGELAQLLALPWAGVVHLERKGMKDPVPIVQVSWCVKIYVEPAACVVCHALWVLIQQNTSVMRGLLGTCMDSIATGIKTHATSGFHIL